MFLALAALKGLIAGFEKPLPAEMIGDFPADKQDGGQNTGPAGQRTGQRQQGGAEHEVVPVINPAGGAAAVVHHPGLEGTEKQNADDVAYTVKSCQTHHGPLA